ncbi:hypothetical protein [Flammeovirga kamogawensis]|uniref:DUF5689 domain-containing protein n=1 Tax=Flammeovirga kamogawensis TaxID=373891 RepID=A0ABX8GQ86_9BACT|nr:hypothetical protein [Flammeovirga kamogawensis]MBB6463064.1 hypothetical protein [Flammeovirga kamogawensis]QWG05701.1 hypothetical protein KM029_09925 [Flammeovirga kamogawensis]TRX67529.1 hypothetical protein EO216_04955 [Flammeovirga kamogawensis]
MKNLFTTIISFILIAILAASCNSNQDDALSTPDQSPVEVKDFALYSFEDIINSGLLQIEKDEKGNTVVKINLHSPATEDLSVVVNSGEFGEANPSTLITLNSITTGESTSASIVSSFDNGSAISYEELLALDAHIIVQNSISPIHFTQLGDAQFIDNQKREYALSGSLEGNIKFLPKENGIMLTVVQLNKPAESAMNPRIISGSALEAKESEILSNLQPILEGTTVSYTNIDQFATPSAIKNGYLNISNSNKEVVSKTDIGGNTLTGNSISYTLIHDNNADIVGTFTLEERENGFSLASVEMTGKHTTDQDLDVTLRTQNFATGQGTVVDSLFKYRYENGIQYKDVRYIKNNTDQEISYTELLNNQYNVFMATSSHYWAKVDIGTAAKTVQTTVIQLNDISNGYSFGTVTLTERIDKTTVAVVKLYTNSSVGTKTLNLDLYTTNNVKLGELYAEGGMVKVSSTISETSQLNILSNVDGIGLNYASLNTEKFHVKITDRYDSNKIYATGKR